MADQKVEVILDEILSSVELIKEEDEIPELRNLLVEDWDLDPTIYAILINHGMTLSYLKALDEKALDDVFSKIKWTGHKHALRYKLEKWGESVLFRPMQPLSSNQLNASTPSSSRQENVHITQPGPSKRKLLPTAVTNNLFIDILQRNEKGKIVTKYYGDKHRLDDEHKRFLAHTIVDYYIANQEYFNLADMERFAQLIAVRFPPEIAETYYNPRDCTANKKHPSGLLYDRFHNRNKKSLINRRATTIDHWKECKAKVSELSSDEIERLSSVKNWLRNNLDPFDEIQLRWKQSILIRLKSILQETDPNKTNILNAWPRITDRNGYLLIDADFDYIYGKTSNSNKLYDTWNHFLVVFRQYINICNLRDQYSLQLLEYLDRDSLAEDTRNFIFCSIFHAVAKPTRTSSRKLPSILQAQVETCHLCDTEEEYTEERDSLRAKENSDVEFCPRIFVIGRPDKLDAFYVVTQKLEYKLPSFLRCLDVVVKLKFVLNYNFPESCEIFWCFVARYFYNINYDRKSKNGQLLQLLSFLEQNQS